MTCDLLAVTKDTEDVEEEVDDVEIEVDGCVDVLLRGDLVHHHVGIVDDEEGKQDCSGNRNSKVHHWAWEKNLKARLHG